MKKSLRALLLIAVAALLFTSCAALAENKPLEISYLGDVTLSPGQSAKVLSTKLSKGGTVTFSLTDTVKKTVVYTETKKGSAGKEIKWDVPYYMEGMSANKPIKEMRASFVLDGKSYAYSLYYNYSAKDGAVTIEKATWYTKNTACSFGPYFREERSTLTDKWYTFTPVDLTIQGRQTFEYVASNMYVIGEVYVDVAGDNVTVTYYNFYDRFQGNTKTLTEFFTIFPDLKSVKDVNPETMDDLGFAFGQNISIEKDLGGDTNVLLFVRNQVTYSTYPTSTSKLTRFWPNLPERKALREQMRNLMDK